MKKEFKMSQSRFDELQKELNYLKTTRSDEVAEMIKVARGFGDLSENSEYDEAKNEQGKLYSRWLTTNLVSWKGSRPSSWRADSFSRRTRRISLVNPEVRRNFEIRSTFIKYLRKFLDDRGYMEVETPVLNTIMRRPAMVTSEPSSASNWPLIS